MICKSGPLICFEPETRMKDRTHDLGKDLGWVQNFVELPEKPTYSINSRSCFPADHIDRFLSYGLSAIQFGAPGSQYIVSGQFRPTHTPYKTLQDRRRRPSCETQNTPMSREHRDPCAVRNSPSPQNLGAQSSVGNTLPHWTFHCRSACTSQSLANAALFPILTCRVLHAVPNWAKVLLHGAGHRTRTATNSKFSSKVEFM